MARPRHPLRQTRHHLPGRRHHQRNPHLATPYRRHTLERRARRRKARELTDKAEERAIENEPEQAAELIEAARTVDPGIQRDSSWIEARAIVFERQVAVAIARVLDELKEDPSAHVMEASTVLGPPARVVPDSAMKIESDLLINIMTDDGRQVEIPVEVKAYRNTVPSRVIHQIRRNLLSVWGRGLIVSSSPGSSGALPSWDQDVTAAENVKFVRWNDVIDDRKLAQAIRQLVKMT